MGWPDRAAVSLLAPSVTTLRYREQALRERVNYNAADGFKELYQSPQDYASHMKWAASLDLTCTVAGLHDDAYNDRLAAERLDHVSKLLRGIGRHRGDQAVEATRWKQREELVRRFATCQRDARFANRIVEDA